MLHIVYKFGELPSSNSEDDGVICVPAYLYLAKNGLPTFIRCAGILKRILEYRNFDFSSLIGSNYSTSCRHG